MNVGDKFKVFQYDISEVRDVEILFIYKEGDDEQFDIILYRYWGLNLKVWHYKLHRRFEFMSLIDKAKSETA